MRLVALQFEIEKLKEIGDFTIFVTFCQQVQNTLFPGISVRLITDANEWQPLMKWCNTMDVVFSSLVSCRAGQPRPGSLNIA